MMFKKKTYISTNYVYDLPNLGLYIVSDKPKIKFSQGWIKGNKRETRITKVRHLPIYVFLELMSKEHFGITLSGQFHYLPHRLFVMGRGRFWPLLIITFKQDWTKIWYKPWKYLKFYMGRPNEPNRL